MELSHVRALQARQRRWAESWGPVPANWSDEAEGASHNLRRTGSARKYTLVLRRNHTMSSRRT
jgi:hypothetical protein